MITKDFTLEIKDVSSTGEFEGFASVYGVEDLGGDVVEAGAFKRSLDHKGGQVPILYQHDPRMPVGKGQLSDSDTGLVIKGKLALGVPMGRVAYELLREKIIDGLSIGAEIVKQKRDGSIRRLQELKLWEVSIVTFAMNPLAAVHDVKSVIPLIDERISEALRKTGPASQPDDPEEAIKQIHSLRDWLRQQRFQ
jgi:HK97 family phage prohead protease